MKTNYNIFFIAKRVTPKMPNSSIVITSNIKQKEYCIKTVRELHLGFDMLPVRKCNRNRIALLLGEVKSLWHKKLFTLKTISLMCIVKLLRY